MYTDTRAAGIFHDHRPATTAPVYVTAADVQNHDGTSTTLLVGENLRADRWTSDREYQLGFLFDPDSALQPINRRDENGDVITATATDYSGARLTSPHPGGVVVTFADGHSRFISDKLPVHVYNKLCTPNGAQVEERSPHATPAGMQQPLHRDEIPGN